MLSKSTETREKHDLFDMSMVAYTIGAGGLTQCRGSLGVCTSHFSRVETLADITRAVPVLTHIQRTSRRRQQRRHSKRPRCSGLMSGEVAKYYQAK